MVERDPCFFRIVTINKSVFVDQVLILRCLRQAVTPMVLENGTVMDVQHPRPGTDRLMHLRTGVGLSLLALVVIAAATAVVKQKPRKLNPDDGQ